MSSIYSFLFLLIISIAIVSCEEAEVDPPDNTIVDYQIKASSFNVRFDNPGDGPNNWHNRKSAIVSFIQSEKLDIVGMQEVLNNQFSYLVANLPEYATIGVGREDGDTRGEYAPIFYRQDLFTVLDSGTFWLSQTPDQPSIGWDAGLERICTWAYFLDNRNGREIHFYNTHFDNVGNQARTESARLIADSIQQKSTDSWVIFMGDLNTEPGTTPYNILSDSDLNDSYDAIIRLGPFGTFNGFNVNGEFNRRIDYIFQRGFSVELYTVNDLVYNGSFISDHFPVINWLAYRPLSL